jgi:tRNA-dihydrouridine synthase 2
MPVYDELGQRVLAPMVRVNTLPMRLLALHYGADVVYSEEIVAKALAASERVENAELGTTDWLTDNGKGGQKVRLRIAAARESKQLVLQLGAGDAVNALAAAQHVADRVAAVDLNMGCPMAFSTSCGMGAALLRTPDVACDILQTLRRNLSVPITCKIRLLPSVAETVELARRLEACGVTAVAVHCREVHHRQYEPALWSEMVPIVDTLNIPVVANGDCFAYEDFAAIREATGAHSVMTARGALWNASIFRPEGLADLEGEVLPRYASLCVEWGDYPNNTKHVMIDMRAAGKKGRVRGPWGGDRDAWRRREQPQDTPCAAPSTDPVCDRE